MDEADRLAAAVAAHFAALPEVVAVALAGSRVAGPALGVPVAVDADLDLYVYAPTAVPLDARAKIACTFAGSGGQTEMDNRFWETGDEWRDAATELWVDVTFRTPEWIEGDLARVLDRHQAAAGYTTAIWHNIRHSRPIADRAGWYARLQLSADRPYSEALRRAIVARNEPILRRFHSSYLRQLDAALQRADPVAANHRLSALLASYFDVLFALNRQPHPGEKRLLAYAEALCPRRPLDFSARMEGLVEAVAARDAEPALLVANDLIADLEALLAEDDSI